MRRNIALVVLVTAIVGATAYAAALAHRLAELEQRVAVLENPDPQFLPADPQLRE